MLRTTLTIALTMILLASTAQAQSVYRWVDDNGEIHYGDSVPTEYKDYGYVRLGPDGTVRERVEPALSPKKSSSGASAAPRRPEKRPSSADAQRKTACCWPPTGAKRSCAWSAIPDWPGYVTSNQR